MCPKRNIHASLSQRTFSLQEIASSAEELKTSQSAIFRHIRNLEIRFSILLVNREASPNPLTRKLLWGSWHVRGIVVVQ